MSANSKNSQSTKELYKEAYHDYRLSLRVHGGDHAAMVKVWMACDLYPFEIRIAVNHTYTRIPRSRWVVR